MKFRIVCDKYSGFELQYKPRFCPIWLQCDRSGGRGINSNRTIEEAHRLAANWSPGGRVVEEFERTPGQQP